MNYGPAPLRAAKRPTETDIFGGGENTQKPGAGRTVRRPASRSLPFGRRLALLQEAGFKRMLFFRFRPAGSPASMSRLLTD